MSAESIDWDEVAASEEQEFFGGVCNCEEYDCVGACCGPGNCTCTPEEFERRTRIVEERDAT